MKGFTLTREEIAARNADLERKEHIRIHGVPPPAPTGVQLESNQTPERKERGPNKTEQRFLDICEARKKRGEIVDYKFEVITFKLAPDCRYTPDVMIQESHEHILFAEVKGPHVREDSRVKFLLAREMHPWASFEMWQCVKREWVRLL